MTVLVLTAATAACLLFVVLYLIEWRHVHHTAEAGHLIAFTTVVGALAGEQLVIEIVGRWPGHDVFINVTVFLAAVLLWQRVYLLVKYQVLPRRRRRRAAREQHVA